MNLFRFIKFSIIKRKRFWNQLRKAKEEKHNNCPNGDSGDGATRNNPEISIVIRDAVGLLVSGILATIFFETDHKVVGLWFSFIGLVAAFNIPFHHIALENPLKKGQVWGCYGILIAVIGVWFFVWSFELLHPLPVKVVAPNPAEPASEKPENFIVERGAIFISSDDNPAFFLVYSNKTGELVRSPVAIMMDIRLKNIRPVPLQIDAYSIEVENGGRWISAETIDPSRGKMFCVANGFQKAGGIGSVYDFNSVIQNHEIPPFQSVEGWAYFSGVEWPIGNNCRFRILDSAGEEYAQTINPITSPSPNDNFDVWANKSAKAKFENSGAMLNLTGEMKDISNLRQIPFSNTN